MKLKNCIPVLTIAVVACGGGEPSETPQSTSTPATGAPATSSPAGGLPAPPTGAMTMPEWYTVDHDAQTVHLTLIAGETNTNNYWNYNGATKGDLAINVPEGYSITIDQVNHDPNMAHSIGILALPSNFAMPPQPNPVFEGALSENPTSMVEATQPGETETIQFTADESGTYGLVCLIPGHAAVGMWLYFIVSDDGEAGVQAR
ncbi:MAG: sulfocyanin-like copper-binding protein [Gemmatimonadota bacterium]|jgi:FtsP/CotA-like multicopper oxidase with cupredoxin domain